MKKNKPDTQDPVELEAMHVFDQFKIRYVRPEHQPLEKSTLDFYLPDFELSVEVKAWSSERLHRQMRNSGKESDGILIFIGIASLKKFARLLAAVAGTK